MFTLIFLLRICTSQAPPWPRSLSFGLILILIDGGWELPSKSEQLQLKRWGLNGTWCNLLKGRKTRLFQSLCMWTCWSDMWTITVALGFDHSPTLAVVKHHFPALIWGSTLEQTLMDSSLSFYQTPSLLIPSIASSVLCFLLPLPSCFLCSSLACRPDWGIGAASSSVCVLASAGNHYTFSRARHAYSTFSIHLFSPEAWKVGVNRWMDSWFSLPVFTYLPRLYGLRWSGNISLSCFSIFPRGKMSCLFSLNAFVLESKDLS